MAQPQTDSSSGTPEVSTFIGSIDGAQAQSGDLLQVEEGGTVKLSWTTANADSVELTDPVSGAVTLGSSDSLEVKPASPEQDYLLVANGSASNSAPSTVHVSTHPAGTAVSTPADVDGTQVQVVIPIVAKVFDGEVGSFKSKYFKFSLSTTIEAEGKIIVGKGVGGEAEDDNGKVIKIQSGYDDEGWKKAVGVHVHKELGTPNITVEELRLSATINKEGVNVAIEVEGNIYGVAAKMTFTLVKVDENWKRLKAGQAELDLAIPFFQLPKIPIGPDMAIDEMLVAPHIKLAAEPNWTSIAEQIAIKLGKKVAKEAIEKSLEGAAEESAEGMAEEAAANVGEGAVDVAAEGASDAAADALTDAAIETAGAEGTAAEGAEDVAMIAGIDVLVASGAVLGLAWIVMKTFEDMEQQQWREEAPGKVTALSANYLEGYRIGIMQEPPPTDADQKLGYDRGKSRFTVIKGKYYKAYQHVSPRPSQAVLDAKIAADIKSNWNGPDTVVTASDSTSHFETYSEQHNAKILCDHTAQATLFAAWAKEGHGGITDWPDRGNAFLAIFGHDPHHNEDEMEPYEKQVWEKFYGAEYADP